MKHFPSHAGQSFTEYSIVVALIAIVSIPFLMNFGETIQDLFASSSDTTHESLKNGGASNTVASKIKGFSKYATTEDLGPYQAKYDPKTGQITYKLPDAMGGGSMTTSVDGATAEVAKMMENMVNDWRSKTGQPMPSDMAAMVKELSLLGNKMAAEQADINAANKACHDNCANTWDLIYLTRDYNMKYTETMEKAQQLGAQFNELEDIVSGYSGVISTVNYANYLKGAYVYEGGTNAKAYELVEGNSHFGKDIRMSATTSQTPAITYNASQQISKSAR